jgi:hypothetical protein
MAVPKATVHENGLSLVEYHQIRPSRQPSGAAAVFNTRTSQHATDDFFGPRSARFYAPHDFTALLQVEYVHRLTPKSDKYSVNTIISGI